MSGRNERNIELIKAKDYDTLVKENMNLVRFILNKMHVPSTDYEDYFQIGCMALFNAAKYFNIDSNVKFSAFAAIAIQRKVAQVFARKLQKQNTIDIVSLDVYTDNMDGEVDLLTLYDDGKRLETDILTTDLYKKIINIMNTKLTETQKEVFKLIVIDGKSQTEIANCLGTSRQNINSLYNNALKKIKKELEKMGIDHTYLSN